MGLQRLYAEKPMSFPLESQTSPGVRIEANNRVNRYLRQSHGINPLA